MASLCPNQRSVWDITWSCLATVFACAWVAVHPDIPRPDATRWANARRRLELMFWTIITPELIVFWAARQWYGARRIERVANETFDAKWTRKHAHFVQMGGLTLSDGDKPIRVLSIWDTRDTCGNGHIKFPTPSLKEIDDRSKSDGLSKILVVGQTTWFIIQVVARAVQGLIITEIEIATLAFAALNAIMYFFWWDKPMDVQSSIAVHLIARLSSVERDIVDPQIASGIDESGAETSLPTTTMPTLRILLLGVQSASSRIFIGISNLFGTFMFFITDGVRKMVNNHWEAVEFDCITRGNTKPGPLRVPHYYAERVGETQERVINILVALCGTVFGGIHCLCWFFAFPSHAERTIWRVCALLITAVPAMGGAFFAITGAHLLSMYGTSTLAWWFRMLVPFYFVARVILITEALITLRDLPSGAFDVVRWTTFFPHI